MQNFTAAAKASEQARVWVLNNAETEESIKKQEQELIVRLCRLTNSLKGASEVLPQRTTLGVFGASQAGKSFLVSNIAAAHGKLSAEWDGVRLDFIKHLNPTGNDKEATGVVTRFTHAKTPSVPGFPCQVRVFSEVELVMVLVNSFFGDLTLPTDVQGESSYLNGLFEESFLEEQFAALEQYRLKSGESSYVSAEDCVALADYVQKVGSGVLKKLDACKPFWVRVRELLPALNLEGRTLIYSLLWGRLKVFTLMFERLAKELLKLKGSTRIYVPLQAFVNVKADGEITQISGGTLNDIACLSHLFDDVRELKVALDDSEHTEVVLTFSCAAALTKEIVFPLTEGSKVEHFDVLDFPGARSRKPSLLQVFLDDEQHFSGNTPSKLMVDNGSEFIRRGKVAFLFESYASHHEVDILIFCINCAKQLDVTDLIPILTGWVNQNVGETAEIRQKYQKIPLLGVLTRFDQALSSEFNQESVTADEDVGRKIIATGFEHIKDQPWIMDWTVGRPFCQFFLMRKPNIAAKENVDWLSSDPDTKEELGFVESAKAKLALIREHVLGDPLFNEHFYGKEQSYEAVMSLNDGGVSYITDFLSKNYQNDRSSKEHLEQLTLSKLEESAKLLSVYAHREGDKAKQQALQEGMSTANDLYQCDKVAQLIVEIRRLLELDELQLEQRYLEDYTPGSNAERFAQETLRFWQQNLKDIAGGSGFNELATLLWRKWERLLPSLNYKEEDKEIYSFFYDKTKNDFIRSEMALKSKFATLMQRFTSGILLLSQADSLNLKETLVKVLEPEEALVSTKESLCKGQVARVMRTLSDFNAYLSAYAGNLDFENLFLKDLKRRPFAEHYEVSYGHPKITEDIFNETATHYTTDFLSAFVSGTTKVSVQSASQYQISEEQNHLLCEILDVLEGSEE
ncbi:MAG: putative virulence factor [Succinivibrio sp.]|nr:putative virulence factor [Succinivibrio sp.]